MWMGGAGPLRPEDDKVYEANAPKVASFPNLSVEDVIAYVTAYLPKPGHSRTCPASRDKNAACKCKPSYRAAVYDKAHLATEAGFRPRFRPPR
jgi:hypothetical protein